MKKTLVLFALGTVFFACGNPPEEVKAPISASVNPQIGAAKASTSNAGSTASEVAETGGEPASKTYGTNGKALIEASDCRACHTDNNRLVGPSYAEVAAKYSESDIPKLAQKVIQGGTGVWGEIPMAPHPSISVSDAESMIAYILTIK